MNCCKMFQLLLPSLMARLLNNSPPSLEMSRNWWFQVAPIKDTCCCHAVNQWPSMPSWLTVKTSPCKHGTSKDRGEDEKISTKQTGLGAEPSEMEHGAISPACRSERTNRSFPISSWNGHIPSHATCIQSGTFASWHPDSKEHYMQNKLELSLQASLSDLPPSWNHYHHRKSSDIQWKKTGLRESKVAMQVPEWWADHQERVNLLFEPCSLLGTHKNARQRRTSELAQGGQNTPCSFGWSFSMLHETPSRDANVLEDIWF